MSQSGTLNPPRNATRAFIANLKKIYDNSPSVITL